MDIAASVPLHERVNCWSRDQHSIQTSKNFFSRALFERRFALAFTFEPHASFYATSYFLATMACPGFLCSLFVRVILLLPSLTHLSHRVVVSDNQEVDSVLRKRIS